MPLFVGGVKGFEGDRAEAAEGRMASAAVVEHQSLAGHSFNQRKQSHLSQQPPTITAAGVPQTGIPMRAVALCSPHRVVATSVSVVATPGASDAECSCGMIAQ